MDCIFCKIINNKIPSFRIYEDENYIAFLDINPIQTGHTLLIPKKHYKNFDELPDKESTEILLITKKVLNILKSKFNFTDYKLEQNNGANSGQIIFHYHLHIIPYFDKSNNNLKDIEKINWNILNDDKKFEELKKVNELFK